MGVNCMRLGDLDALHDLVMESMRYNPHTGHIERIMHRHEHESFLREIRRAPTIDATSVVQRCDGAGVDPAEHAAVCRERDELKRELEETKELLEAAKNAQGLLQIYLVKVQERQDALLEIVRKSVEACDYCKNIGAACPCFDMLPPPECDECTLEKSICCKCRAGSHFEFAGVQEGGGG